MISKQDNKNGFTLIELLVAMAISGIVMAGIYSVYYSQQKSYMAQEQLAVMQQNIRAAMFFMGREIRMAGCDPSGQAIDFADWDISSSSSFKFTLDIRGNTAGSLPDGDTKDSNEEITYSLYTATDGVQKLGRKSSSTANNQPVAENITSLNFTYLNANNNVTTNASAVRSVEITLVAATEDNVRSRSFTTNIKCRNMGL
ncbi:MAG: prepilin-type N-terminal cleavage/methylation domain-containing protein [Deltaproteobacteria bacterium]|nr:prepilin-type N-terminal cleavage/methylation domain-containing protein [Deltaproteobacteria bacterium]